MDLKFPWECSGGKRWQTEIYTMPISKTDACGQRENGLACELTSNCETQFHANIADVEKVVLVFDFVLTTQIVFGSEH